MEATEPAPLPAEVRTALAAAHPSFSSGARIRLRDSGSTRALVLGETHVLDEAESAGIGALLDCLLSHTSTVAVEGTPAPLEKIRRYREPPRRAERILYRLLFGIDARQYGPATQVEVRATEDRRIRLHYLEREPVAAGSVLVGLLFRPLLFWTVAGLLVYVPARWIWTGSLPGAAGAILLGCFALLLALVLLSEHDEKYPGSHLVLALPTWLRLVASADQHDLVTRRDRSMAEAIEALAARERPELLLVIVGSSHLSGILRELEALGWSSDGVEPPPAKAPVAP